MALVKMYYPVTSWFLLDAASQCAFAILEIGYPYHSKLRTASFSIGSSYFSEHCSHQITAVVSPPSSS